MNRLRLAALLLTALLGGCLAPTPRPSSTPGPADRPTDTPAVTPSPIATAPRATSAALDCDPAEAMPYSPEVLLSVQDGDHVDDWLGLNGTAILEGELQDHGPWHQPSPRQSLPLGSGDQLVVHVRRDEESIDPETRDLCMERIAVDVAPFSPTAVNPDLSNLASLAASSVHTDRLAFAAPRLAGEWIVRVTVAFATSPAPSRQESFFRLLVDTPYPATGGRARVAPACSKPGRGAPDFLLTGGDVEPVAGEIGTLSWRGAASDGGYRDGPRVHLPKGNSIVIRIVGGVCAAAWRIELGPRPVTGLFDFEPMAEVAPSHDGMEDVFGAANRFELAEIPPGDWDVSGRFVFVNGRAEVIGDALVGWNLVVSE